jgi:uncharacterized protein YxeA
VEDERSYYHIAWTPFSENGNEKEVALSINAGDEERVVLLFDSFDRAKRYMHTFLAKEGIANWRDLEPNMAVIPVMGGQSWALLILRMCSRWARRSPRTLSPAPDEKLT